LGNLVAANLEGIKIIVLVINLSFYASFRRNN